MLGLNDKINYGKMRGGTVEDLVKKEGKSAIFSLIKSGHTFSDEVLSFAGIKKVVHDVHTTTNECFEKETDTKVYEKDTVKLSKILKEINSIDYAIENNYTNFEDETHSI